MSELESEDRRQQDRYLMCPNAGVEGPDARDKSERMVTQAQGAALGARDEHKSDTGGGRRWTARKDRDGGGSWRSGRISLTPARCDYAGRGVHEFDDRHVTVSREIRIQITSCLQLKTHRELHLPSSEYVILQICKSVKNV